MIRRHIQDSVRRVFADRTDGRITELKQRIEADLKEGRSMKDEG